MEPIESAAARLWPEARTISILVEGLSADRMESVELSPALIQRIVDLGRYAEAEGSDGILFTCSAFGAAVDQAGSVVAVPVIRPNEAMFEAAFSCGRRVLKFHTFPPAARGMEREFREAAAAAGNDAHLSSVYRAGALEARKSGDRLIHDRLIAETASGITGADVILLAQFPMASAAEEVHELTTSPVLTGPESAIRKLRRRVAERPGD